MKLTDIMTSTTGKMAIQKNLIDPPLAVGTYSEIRDGIEAYDECEVKYVYGAADLVVICIDAEPVENAKRINEAIEHMESIYQLCPNDMCPAEFLELLEGCVNR